MTNPAQRTTPPPFAARTSVPSLAQGEAWGALVRRCQQGLDDEMRALEQKLSTWGGDVPLPVVGATFEGMEGDTWIYTVRVGTRVTPPDYSAVEIRVPGPAAGAPAARGVVEAVEPGGGEMTIALDEKWDGWDNCQLSFDSTALLRATSERMQKIEPAMGATLHAAGLMPPVDATSLTATIAERDAKNPDEENDFEDSVLNARQSLAVQTALDLPLHLTFGPPGTGKTKTLAALVAEAVARGERVMISAHTNAALDAALGRLIADVPELHAAGKIMRLGRPTRGTEHRGLSVTDAFMRRMTDSDRKHREVVDGLRQQLVPLVPTIQQDPQLARLWSSSATGPVDRRVGLLLGLMSDLERRTNPALKPVCDAVRAAIEEIQRERKGLQSALSSDAPILGVTLSRLMISSADDIGVRDRLVLDEASMAMLPQVLVASASARALSGFGDPRQLPPIVQANTASAQTSVGCDVFRHLALGNPSTVDARITLLNAQYRMRPSIREMVSKLFYDSLLIDGEGIVEGENPRASLWLLDTSATPAKSERAGSSRVNDEHASMIATLVKQLEREGRRGIGVITPFAAQSRRLRSELQVQNAALLRTGGFIKTIHKSQGGEEDTIILDLVDAGGRSDVSSFLDERRTPDLHRLLCVALSRAQNQLIIVANAKAYRARDPQGRSLVMRILREAYRVGSYRKVPSTWRKDGPILVADLPTLQEESQSQAQPVPPTVQPTVQPLAQPTVRPTIQHGTEAAAVDARAKPNASSAVSFVQETEGGAAQPVCIQSTGQEVRQGTDSSDHSEVNGETPILRSSASQESSTRMGEEQEVTGEGLPLVGSKTSGRQI